MKKNTKVDFFTLIMSICDVVLHLPTFKRDLTIYMNATYVLPKHYTQKLTLGYEKYFPRLTKYIYTKAEHL